MTNYKVALAGNPNVGKSTVFNALTGLKQHTGNWAGKTVSNAKGFLNYDGKNYEIYDLPGTYSLIPHSNEEMVARDFICFNEKDVTVIVCDAVCLERNLNLVLQILEVTSNVIVCVNLMDEAKKKKIKIDLECLEGMLGVPVVGTSARNKKGLDQLINLISKSKFKNNNYKVKYPKVIENLIEIIESNIKDKVGKLNPRWVSLKLIDNDLEIHEKISDYLGYDIIDANKELLNSVYNYLLESNIKTNEVKDILVNSIVLETEIISKKVVTFKNENYQQKDHKIDKFLTSRKTGIPIMLCLLMTIFWITITGANYPSSILFDFLFWLSDKIEAFLNIIHVPKIIISVIVDGIYKVLAWVVAVMLPPMAIFFPLFTLLEDLGYLPRIAFNLDKYFHKCSACGKQALTMCMGFGCNAAGVTGARIIDSPRERLLAILTNNFVPCNGRFPTMIIIISIFFISSSLGSSLILTCIILLGIFMTLLVSKVLSLTILKGVPSSFTLELPPYRKPKIIEVVIRSIFDRTLFVLGRAILVAAPAGLLIWMMSNINVGGVSLLNTCASFLDPIGHIFGLDGMILMAFILGFPANEIVVPILIMGYMSLNSITDISDLSVLKNLLVNNGWTFVTAISFLIFSLMHFPCSTTCLTIKKETGSFKWVILAFLIPTIIGLCICLIFTQIVHLLGFY